MTDKIRKATHKGALDINRIKIQCYVLEDGTRVLSQRGVINALGMSHGSLKNVGGGGARLAAFFGGEWLKPFISNKIVPLLIQPYKFITNTGAEAFAYDATILVDICDAIMEARRNIAFSNYQNKIADRCEILLCGFAKIGIIALVDEATGYQEVRDKLALQKILDKYLLKDYAKWAKRFPDEFYELMFSLKGWQWQGMIIKRPGVVGKYTNDLVYERLAPGILGELKRLNPPDERGQRKSKHHQWLTQDIGHPALQQHIHTLTAFMRASSNWDQFYRMVDRAFTKFGDTIPMRFSDDE